MEMVVTGESKKDTESRAQGEEDLRSSINPNLAGEATGRLENRHGVLGLGGAPRHAYPIACLPHSVPTPQRTHPTA